MKRSALVAACLAIGLLATGAPAGAEPGPEVSVQHGVTQPVFSYPDAIREHVRVQSPVDSDGDGKKDLIRADIIRPKETNDGLRVPVIMHASPYFDTGLGWERETKSYDQTGNATKIPLFLDNYFVPRGYALVSVDMTGTAKSDGCPTAGGAPDVLGAKAVIDWLNGRAPAYDASGKPVRAASWTTGRTGMIGMSYDGLLATGVAGTGVAGLATVVPIAQGSSLYEMLRANGTLSWFRDGLAQIAGAIDKDPPEKCAAVRKQLSEGVDDETGNYNAFWHERNYRSGPVADVRRVRASVLAVMGVNDLNVKPSQLSLWWNGLAKRVTRKLWLTQYGHVDPFDFRRDRWVSTLHQWFDHELWGIPNDVLRQPRADVQLGPDRWITQPDWPAPKIKTLRLRPDGDGSLRTRPSSGTGSYTDAILPEADLIADPGTAKPSRLAYLTPALKQDLRLSGTPEVSLKLSSDKPAANVSALLVDYGRDTRINPAYGIKRAPGEDCVGESTAQDDGCYWRWVDDTVTRDAHVVGRGMLDAQNRESLSSSTPLTPGKPYQITWSLLPTDYLLKAGHRLGLVLAGTDAELAAAETPTGAKVTLDLGGTTISVPVVATSS